MTKNGTSIAVAALSLLLSSCPTQFGQIPGKSQPTELQGLFLGEKPGVSLGEISTDANYKKFAAQPIGFIYKIMRPGTTPIFQGVTPNKNEGTATVTQGPFLDGLTTKEPIGYLPSEKTGRGSQQLFAITGATPPAMSGNADQLALCKSHRGMISTNPEHLRCLTQPIGWTVSP